MRRMAKSANKTTENEEASLAKPPEGERERMMAQSNVVGGGGRGGREAKVVKVGAQIGSEFIES